jgi:hypothetical protein
MAFSGHRTPSMLRRYHILNIDDLRTAAVKGSAYGGGSGQVIPPAEAATAQGTRRERGE